MDEIRKVLLSVPLFKSLQEDTLENLIRSASLNTHTKKKILFIHEEKAERFFLIKSGWVKLFRETLEGDQAVIDILPQGHLFGEMSVFEGGVYPYSAEVVDKSEIISLPTNILKSEMEKNHDFALAFLDVMAKYRNRQDNEIEHRVIQNAPQRIGCFLLRLEKEEKDGIVRIHLPYDKTLVAARLGMQPETFSRALSKLKKETGIRVQGAYIEMDSIDPLASYSCIACSSEFPCGDLGKTGCSS